MYTTVFDLSVSVLMFTHTFLLPIYNDHLKDKMFSLESIFAMFGNCCISATVSESTPGQNLKLQVQNDKIPTFILASERGFYYIQFSNSSWLE